MKKNLSVLVTVFAVLLLGVLVSVAMATNYVFKVPSDVKVFYDRNGTAYTPDAQGRITITNSKFITDALGAGFTYEGFVPLILTKDYTSYRANNATQNATSLDIPAAFIDAGKALKFTCSGITVGTNAAKSFKLSAGGTDMLTLTTGASNAADFTVNAVILGTGNATQRVYGSMHSNGVAPITDYATGAVDFTSALTVKTKVVSGNAGDNATQTACIVEYLP